MRILVISQMFPCKRHPISAVFFANLMKELAPMVDDLIIVTPRLYVPRFLTKFKKRLAKWFLDPMVSNEMGVKIIRPYVLSLPGDRYAGINGLLMQYCLFNLIKNLIKTKKIELILGYNMQPEGIAAVGLSKKLKLPGGFWVIGSDVNTVVDCNRINNYLSKKSIEESKIIFTESKDLENKIRVLNNEHLNVHTFYKGIDISSFSSIPSKGVLIEELKLNRENRHILFVGRLTSEKGIYELAQIFRNVSKLYPDFKLILIGEEIEKEKMVMILNDYGILNKVIFRGIVPYKEVAHYMKASDLFVFPTWNEGLPNVIMEAMAIGLPVVASNVGGIPEVLINGVTGLSEAAKNVDKLTDAVIKLIENKTMRETFIRNARQSIHEKFDVKKNVNRLYEFLEGLKMPVTQE